MNSAALSLAASMFESALDNEQSLSDTNSELYILGIKYTTPNDACAISDDILSRYWFTYRTNFAPIGGPSGPTKDTGWGCMMRCGQMMLAEAYLRFFLPAGRYFRWHPNSTDKSYWEILNMFIDRKHASYSIHQIAQMGTSEGKEIGQWFGPNTIAQVLKRLASNEFDKQVTIHVAMNNILIIEDVLKLCRLNSKQQSQSAVVYSNENSKQQSTNWRPLILIIPLRLGLNDVNIEYIDQLKICLRIPQTIGCIGGKPNHAYYFVGYLDPSELLYLDPHVTQSFVDTTVQTDDMTYHCDRINRMKFSGLDPSLALGFACKTEAEFEDLIEKLRKNLSETTKHPMFEICDLNPFDSHPQTIPDNEGMP
ncbi:unnamed protein product, partial [Didymodactylos carnosus]